MIERSKLTPVNKLSLDPGNPRLPRNLQDSKLDQEALVDHYYEFAVINELIDSMLLNGFFQHEALIASRKENEDGRHTVWEGNRRLSALKIINRDDCPENIPEPLLQEASEHDLSQVPVVFVDSYEDVKKFIGYRHISGLKTWPAEAKARFVTSAVKEAIAKGDSNPFKTVGKEIGSNASGVRGYYLAELTLEAAEDSGADTSVIRRDRFGVWQRLWNSSGLRQFLDFPETKTAADLTEAIGAADEKKLTIVANDLSKKQGPRFLVPDSRDLDSYGKVLANPLALKTFRETEDLRAAAEIIAVDVLAERFQKVLRTLDILYDQVFEANTNDLQESEVIRLSKKIKAKAAEINRFILESDDE